MPTVSGKLVDQQTGSPVPFVVVQIGPTSTSSGLDGNFRATVPIGTHELKIRSPTHRPITEQIIVGQDVTKSFQMTRKIIQPQGF